MEIYYWLSIFSLGLSFLCFIFWCIQTKRKQSFKEQIYPIPLEGETKHFLKRFSGENFWTKPSFFIKQVSNQNKIESQIQCLLAPFTLENFLGCKQFLWLLMTIFFWGWLWFGSPTWPEFFRLIFFILLILIVPDLWLKAKVDRHLQNLSQEIPYFIDLLSLTLQSGLNIEQALAQTTHHRNSPLKQTIHRKVSEMQHGKSLDQIITELKVQIPDPEFQHFITSINRAKKLGVSLAETLEIQSKIIRTRRRQRAEELSRSAAVKLSIPLVLFIFPALLIIYIGPGILNLMQQT